jgi:hypothetical protein
MGEAQHELLKWLRYVLNQHNQGMKLDDLLVELSHIVQEGKLSSIQVELVLDALDSSEDLDYLIYGTNRYFVFER